MAKTLGRGEKHLAGESFGPGSPGKKGVSKVVCFNTPNWNTLLTKPLPTGFFRRDSFHGWRTVVYVRWAISSCVVTSLESMYRMACEGLVRDILLQMESS